MSRWSTAPSWSAARAAWAESIESRARLSTSPTSRSRRGRQVQGAGLRRHRPHLQRAARRAAAVLHPADAQPAHLPARGRARHSPEQVHGAEPVAQLLEGFTRSLGKEIGRGGTAQLVYVAPRRRRDHLPRLLLSKSAYVSGQVIRIGAHGPTEAGGQGLGQAPDRQGRPRHRRQPRHRRADRPGAHRDGAAILGIDVPQAASELQAGPPSSAATTSPSTSPARTQRIAQHVKEKFGVDIVVHNAGITRDKKLANMKQDGFASTIAVNLTAPKRITTELLTKADQRQRPDRRRRVDRGHRRRRADQRRLEGRCHRPRRQPGRRPQGRHHRQRGRPGFIETKMTAAVPFATREVGGGSTPCSRAGSRSTSPRPSPWYANPGSTAVNGNVVRVWPDDAGGLSGGQRPRWSRVSRPRCR